VQKFFLAKRKLKERKKIQWKDWSSMLRPLQGNKKTAAGLSGGGEAWSD